MPPGLPFAIAAQLANPRRQVVAFVGDGGLAMLMTEISTAVKIRLPVKIIAMRNDMLAEVVFEQKEPGTTPYRCELGDIDSAQVAVATSCNDPRLARYCATRGSRRSGRADHKTGKVKGEMDVASFVIPSLVRKHTCRTVLRRSFS